ncbi:Dna-directed rna polymerase alpha chain [Plasmodium coatneyi]|uniref:Dna-directed rna polymerase alpha chain n=1 Tax=Plasmodium coatneyi TaxID=208452 RepID=A0A1B1E432_9APIC|nr:Dna-directed rna polymerase alpha chain [Plasmodium coatneyi]ANQ09690.1 Dna-directed rna polymerase alpha chain [Plasmodium coatneyi]
MMLFLLLVLAFATASQSHFGLILKSKNPAFLPVHTGYSKDSSARGRSSLLRRYYTKEESGNRKLRNRDIFKFGSFGDDQVSDEDDSNEYEEFDDHDYDNVHDDQLGDDHLINEEAKDDSGLVRFDVFSEGKERTEEGGKLSGEDNPTANGERKDELKDELEEGEDKLEGEDSLWMKSRRQVAGKHRYNVYSDEVTKKDGNEIDLQQADKIDRKKAKLPPYIYEGGKAYEGKSEDYEPEVYDFHTYNKYFDELCKEKKSTIDSYQLNKNQLDESYFDAKKGGPKTFGFKFKQIQPVKYHQGRAYTYFFMHSHEVELSPIFLNAFRRVAIKHLKGGRVTALRIPNMKHEFYCIVGVRENFFDLAQNLRQITFKNVPEDADMDNYITGKFRIKGPMIVVAGHMQLPKGIEIVNKNQYICSVSAGSYLEMDVKIESIEEYVMPEYGSQSRNRDICKDNFIHFSSSCTPVEYFGFMGQRRGINLDTLGEINILEMHTDGSITPKSALLKTIDYISENFQYMENALYNNCHTCDDGSVLEEFRNPEFYMDKDRYTDVPWNKYKTTAEELEDAKKWLYRKDVHRQYDIDPESAQSKQEREILWEKKKKFLKEIDKRREQIKKGPSVSEGEYIPSEERHDCLLDWPVDKSERNMNPPRWVIERPLDKNPHVGHEEIYDEGI